MQGALVGLVALGGCHLVFELDQPACPAGRKYTESTTTANWGNAHAQCIASDPVPDDNTFTHLLVLTDGEEAQAVGLTVDQAWIGLHNISGTWFWVTNEFPDDANAPWQTNKPTDQQNLCANLQIFDLALDDAGCGMEKTFICECDEFAVAP